MTRRASGSEQNIGDAYNTYGKVYLEFDENASGPNMPVQLVFELTGGSIDVYFNNIVVGGITVSNQVRVQGTTHFTTVNVPPGQVTYSFSCPWSTGTTYYSGSGTVTCRPQGLSIVPIESYPDGGKFRTSITSYGVPDDGANRYIEAAICQNNSYAEPYRFNTANLVTSADITVTNSSYAGGPMTIQPNTQYYYGMFASNTPGDGSLINWTMAGQFVTTPNAPTVTSTGVTYNSASFSYSTTSDNNYYSKLLQYSIDNGSTWNTYATVSTGSASSGTFTVTGLSPNTTYNVKTRVTTTAGITNGADVSVTTIGSAKPIVTTSNITNNSITITYKETSFNSPSGRKLELYGGTSASPNTLLETQSSPVENTDYAYNHTGLTSNQHYYYRGVAYADFDGSSVAVSSDDVSTYTLPDTPTITEVSWKEFTTSTTQTFNIKLSIPASGGALTQYIQYRTLIDGTYSAWTTLTTVLNGSATTFEGTFTVSNTTAQQISAQVQVRSLTEAGNSGSDTEDFTIKAKPGAPTVSEWKLVDTNATSVEVTGDDTVFIEGYSIPTLSVKESNITLAQGVTLTTATGTFAGTTQSLILSSGTYSTSFASPESGTYTGTLHLVDSLSGEYADSVSRTVLAYSEPTITGSFSYVSEDGEISISIAGEYSPLVVSGVDKNELTVSYKVSADEMVVDWTEVEYSTNGNDFTAYVNNVPTTYYGTYLVELKVVDALGNEALYSFEVSALEKSRFLSTPQYDIEVWTRNGDFVADITHYLTTDLSITWKLNDVEELSFSVSLDALELLKENGLSIVDLLTPYAHDVRVRRNGDYIVGCQVVEANIKIDNEQIPVVEVKATGFLNIFKDQYISEPMAGYTYPEMAHKLINRAQHADCLIKNPTGDIDASYWLSDTSSIAQTTISYAGAGAIQATSSSSPTTLATQMSVESGVPISLNVWISGAVGTINVYERELINQSSNQVLIGTLNLTSANTYTQLVVNSYTTNFENGYIYFSETQTGTPLRIDNCFVSRIDDEDSLNNHYVGCIYVGLDDTTGGTGHNYATSGYTDREFNYELQNVKDAIMNLTQMGEDYFEFEFTPDRIFNTYDRKGSDRTDIEIYYPGNVHSMTVTRSAADMANKIQEIGSGIGDERLEAIASNYNSRVLYGTRESVVTANNVSLIETLQGLAQGELDKRGVIYPSVSVTIQDGSINCANIQTGDVIAVRIGEYLGVLGQQQAPQTNIHLEMFGNIEGWYKVKQIQAKIPQNGGETITLQLDYVSGLEES